jgi:hypothetical protein
MRSVLRADGGQIRPFFSAELHRPNIRVAPFFVHPASAKKANLGGSPWPGLDWAGIELG